MWRCGAPLATTTIDGINYACSEPPALVKGFDGVWLAAAFIGLTARFGDAGMALFVPAAGVAVATVAAVRWLARRRLASQVDRALDLEAWRTAKGRVVLH